MPASPAQSLYDHERPRRRPAPDWGGDELFDAVPRRRFRRVEEEVAPEPAAAAPRPAPALAPAPAPPRQELVEPAPARRTVTITGHPGRSRSLERPRAGSDRSLEQRLHARPDRLMAWAVALGLLLAVIAVATSG